MATVISFASQKGGVGKTTSAVHLATAFALGGYRTLLLDLDPQGSVYSAMGVKQRVIQGTLEIFCQDSTTLSDVLLPTSTENMHLILNDVDRLTHENELMKVAAANSGLSFNRIGMLMCTAAWQEGDDWLDDLLDYLAINRAIFAAAIDQIPGLRMMPMDATYLCWVDFSGTGMSAEDCIQRVEKDARIAVNHGATFGQGGETFLRFNIACRRAMVEEAVDRLKQAFADLQ